MIRSRLKRLRLDKEEREGRKLTYETISKETKLSPGALVRLMNSEFDRIDVGTLNTLCLYFGVAVGEVLEFVPDEKAGNESNEAVDEARNSADAQRVNSPG